MLRCPWHNWEFDIRTGKSWFDPRRTKVRAFPAHVEPGAALVEGPYQAETFSVKVEAEYVVVDV
jgi:3-phenylpropionate/trans-cinnamate dioxygenase ferredoxin subunit